MWWFSTALVAALAAGASSPPLSIHLETSWPAPPLFLEILETIQDEQPNSFWPFLHLVANHIEGWQEASTEEFLANTISLIASYRLLPSPGSISTFNYALGLHTTVPRIEAFYSWYEHHVNDTALGTAECPSWVEWKGKGFCRVFDLIKDMELSLEDGHHHSHPIQHLLPFDHISPCAEPSTGPHAVLYFNPENFVSVHFLNYLEKQAEKLSDFQYIVRYRPPISTLPRGQNGEKRTVMSGYGVEMALKKTDYLVVDDRTTSGSSASGSGGTSESGGSKGFLEDILGGEQVGAPLTASEVNNISLKAASLIMGSSDPLDTLLHLSQDFPRHMAPLARKVEIPIEITRRAKKIIARGQAQPAIFINGKGYADNDVNAFSLLKILREERKLMLSLTSLGLLPQQAFELLSDSMIGQAQTEDDVGDGIVDASDRLENGKVITWWNDIEKDKKYKTWPDQLSTLLRHVYPGQFHTLRKNLYNLVFVLDFSLASSLDVIAGSIASMIQRGIPIRFGVVPMFDGTDDLSFKLARIFAYCTATFGRGLTREMMVEIIQATPSTPTKPGIINLSTVRSAYETAAQQSRKEPLPFDEILAQPVDQDWLAAIQSYTSRLLTTKEESSQGHLFINGKHAIISGAWTSLVQQELSSQLQVVQETIATATSPLQGDISTFFYDLPGVPTRRSKLIVPGPTEKLNIFNLLDVFADDITGKLSTEMIYTSDTARGAPISMWVIGDLDSPEGLQAALDALRNLQTPDCASRMGFVHVPTPSSIPSNNRFSTLLYHLMSTSTLSHTTANQLIEIVEHLRESSQGNLVILGGGEDTAQKVLEGGPLHSLTGGGWDVIDTAAAGKFWDIGRKIGQRLGLKSSLPHLLVNGRLVGPITPTNFPAEDFDALEVYEHRKRVKPVIDLLKTMYDDMMKFDRPTLANLVATTSSIIASAYKGGDAEGIFTPAPVARGRFYEDLDEGDLSFHLGEPHVALVHVAAVFDPVSEQAQAWTPILKVLSQMENIAVSVYLDPDPDLSEVKLKRYYRAALSSKLNFDVDGNEAPGGVTFLDLPAAPIYTLAMDTPQAWIVSPRSSPYDLDNLQLSKIHEPINVYFNLKQLLIEGHAREGANVPPRGLQLQLTSRGMEVASDTLVMANLGYLQFKVLPGVYDLHIRAGRGQEVYNLESTGNDGWDSPTVNVTGTGVALTSFEGVTILPRFSRKLGMESADVLMESEAVGATSYAGAVFQKMKEMVGLAPTSTALAKSRHADINIFTVASGLLYERFASIMILSVLKHTNHSVKFWFIENFLSPTFLRFLPKMAEEYGFQYEFVTYKFPQWLRAQTEKQRIIWAYKTLFLDVLFPLDLDKVIFVDADQIVRTDMKELVDVDLHGRVYGMAPMGDSRAEMEGFRFWKTGYWKDVLRGRPYHISALYVVDLKRFRQFATGDRLRGQYHALAADPNSLANLDQDLPNSMQDTIPIWSLDQDWLWCQTWCSDESLSTAKTIDLCQNPLTKEPKLVRARQIPEWDTYDKEIAAFAARLADQGDESGALAASVDDLAGQKDAAESPKEDSSEEKERSGGGSIVDETESSHHIEGEL